MLGRRRVMLNRADWVSRGLLIDRCLRPEDRDWRMTRLTHNPDKSIKLGDGLKTSYQREICASKIARALGVCVTWWADSVSARAE